VEYTSSCTSREPYFAFIKKLHTAAGFNLIFAGNLKVLMTAIQRLSLKRAFILVLLSVVPGWILAGNNKGDAEAASLDSTR
jgi:hypothetical protein